MLASAPDSLSHWAAHARLERIRNRPNDARKVYQTILTASSSLSSYSRSGTGILWWDWAEMEWLHHSSDIADTAASAAALQVILRSASVEPTSTGGIAILRAKRQLSDTLANIPATPNCQWKEREAWIKLRALLELLTVSPWGALSIFELALGALEVGRAAHESMTLASLQMLYHCSITLRNPVPPALLRERAEKALSLYPNNTAILGIFLETQKGQAIWGRVRALLGDTTNTSTTTSSSSTSVGGGEKDVTRRVAEIWVAGCWEKGRWEAEQERTRSGLSAAVQDDRYVHMSTAIKIHAPAVSLHRCC